MWEAQLMVRGSLGLTLVKATMEASSNTHIFRSLNKTGAITVLLMQLRNQKELLMVLLPEML